MKTIKHSVWEINATNTPYIRRRCSKCNCTSLFYCSNCFRLNSQKKYIDVWLIYRCENCDTTYNLSILSRTKPESIGKDLYRRFLNNDEELARTYAFDKEIIRKNNVLPDYSRVEYTVSEEIDIHGIKDREEDIFEFEIKVDYNLNLRIKQLIRRCLGISLRKIDELIDNETITLLPAGTPPDAKIKNGIVIRIDKDAWINDAGL